MHLPTGRTWSIAREPAHAELAARMAHWDVEATAIGFAEADQQQALAFERREVLAFQALLSPLAISPTFSRKSCWSCGWDKPRMGTMRFLSHKSNPSSVIFGD
jgi:hypothetical protein